MAGVWPTGCVAVECQSCCPASLALSTLSDCCWHWLLLFSRSCCARASESCKCTSEVELWSALARASDGCKGLCRIERLDCWGTLDFPIIFRLFCCFDSRTEYSAGILFVVCCSNLQVQLLHVVLELLGLRFGRSKRCLEVGGRRVPFSTLSFPIAAVVIHLLLQERSSRNQKNERERHSCIMIEM